MLRYKLSIDLKSDIFLLPHHGSKMNLNQKVLKSVNPDYVISSHILNSNGHPCFCIDMVQSFLIKKKKVDPKIKNYSNFHLLPLNSSWSNKFSVKNFRLQYQDLCSSQAPSYQELVVFRYESQNPKPKTQKN